MTPAYETQQADQLVATLDLHCIRHPNDRLLAALAKFGAAVTVVEDLQGADGRVVLGDGSAEIFLDRRLDLARRRFVVAHELGHILVSRHQLYEHLSTPLDSADAEEEVLCDNLALALLIPPQCVAAINRRPSLDLLRDTARALGVPVSVVTQRVAQLRHTNLPLLLARRSRGHWVTTRTAGVPSRRFYPHMLVDTEALDRLGPRETRQVSFVMVGPGRSQWRVEADARVDGDATMILVKAPPEPLC